jgi:hypothetical protein
VAWVKLDDGFVDHPKIARVGMVGAWLQIQALCYANRNLTDGFIPAGIVPSFLARGTTRLEQRTKGELTWTVGEHNGMQGLDLHDVDWPQIMVNAELWEPVDGGYVIHDYHDYQPTKADVEAARKAWNDRQKRHREKMSRRDSRVTHASPVPVPVPQKRKNISLASLAPARDVGFEEFWSLYPRHVGKQAALRAWRKLHPPLEAIRTALAWQREQPRWREDPTYIPHPATYLNGRRWEDEPPPHKPTLAELEAEIERERLENGDSR